jgi:hypothetical protein
MAVVFILMACVFSAKAQDGTYKVSESWSVTLYRGSANVATRFTGTDTGTLAITNGSYAQIDRTGLASLGKLRTMRTIYYDPDSGYYTINGAYPFSAFASGPGEGYAIIQLSFFVIKVPLGTQSDIPSPYPYDSSVFTTTGISLTSLSGAGTMVDENAAYGPVGPSYYVNEVDDFSISKLTAVAPPGAVAPKITTQPVAQTVLLGDSPMLSVAATGTEPLSFQWKHDGTNLFDEGEFSGSTTSTLTISGVESFDAGSYSVVVSNVKGSVTSAKAVLTIGASVAVQINGGGKVTPDYDGEILPVGKKYTMTAKPNTGNLFAGWTGSIATNTPTLSFIMQSNLVLQANFVTNLFLAAQGAYNGLFAPTTPPRQQTNSGSFTVNVTSAGALSGNLFLGSETIPLLNGKFDVSGATQLHSTRKGKRTLTTTLQLNLADRSVQGTVTDGSFAAVLSGDQAVFSSTHKAANFQGQYTLIIPGTDDPNVGPFGTSYGTATVDALGNITFSGSLADGTSVSRSSVVSKDGFWPFYVPLYGGTGSLWGWNYFTNHTIISAPYASWINATNSTKTAVYRSGFTNEQAAIIGSFYTSTNKPLLSLTNAQVILVETSPPFSITDQITLASNNTIKVTDAAGKTNKLTLTIKTSGLITGSFLNPANAKQTIQVNGVLLQNQTNAQGYFLGTNQSGTFILAPLE